MLGVRLDVKTGGTELINFDVKARLEERERKSQMVVVNFSLTLSTKPSVVKFEIEGAATLTGKDSDVNRLLGIDPETKVPHVFHRIYQNAFTAMYLLSTILNTPPPPQDLLFSNKQQGLPMEEVNVEVAETAADLAKVQAETESKT